MLFRDQLAASIKLLTMKNINIKNGEIKSKQVIQQKHFYKGVKM